MEAGMAEKNGATELVLRGRHLEQGQEAKACCVVVHVLWGEYEEAGRLHEGFGLQMEDGEGVVRKIPDLSTDAREVAGLAERMNRYRISRYHFEDVIEDFLAAV